MATEEQTAYNVYSNLYSGYSIRRGQRLTISNRTVTKLSFPLIKYDSPTGNVTFTIRAVSANGYAEDEVINSKVWGDASALNPSLTWQEVTFATPVLINEEVRILAEFSGGDSSNYIRCALQSTDVKASEYRTNFLASYTDTPTNDFAYIYTYTIAGTYRHQTTLTPKHLYEGTLKPKHNYARTLVASHLYETKMEASHKYTAKMEAK